jgi:oxygen-independent coproporphyrinogen-3 oxidase
VVTGQDDRIDLYIEALAAELAQLGRPRPVWTLFLGGGTPTHLSCRQLEALLTTIRRWLNLEPGYEFSIEANPGTLAVDKIAVLADHGVNRLSLGAQSFHPHLLKVLERNHDPADVGRSVEAARKHIANISLDLIFGVPGQTQMEWRADLEQALALEPSHLSTYGLTFEKGTRLWKQRAAGELQVLSEETELTMYLTAMDCLHDSGFEHYEISSFAHARRRCRHNQVYWANEAYFGFGVSAARYVEGRREVNTRDINAYLRRALAGDSCAFQSEVLPPEQRARETLAVQLRRSEGVIRHDFLTQTGFDVDRLAGPAIARHVDLGLLDDSGSSIRLTRRGKCVADSLIEKLL